MAAVAEQKGNPALRLGALVARGTVHSTRTPLYDEAQAEALAAEGLALARELGDRSAAARINWNLMLLMLARARGRPGSRTGLRGSDRPRARPA
jgi:hypothetical protein